MKREEAPKFLEALEDGIYIIKKDYTIEYMNTAMMNLFGDGVGKKCYEIINRRDVPCPWCNYEHVFNQKETRSEEVYIEWVKRNFKVIEIPVGNRDGTTSKLSIYKDVTHKKEQEARLKSSKEDFRRLFENVGCGVFQSTREGRFLDVNPALLKMLGYNDKEEFLSLDLATELYLKPEDRHRYMEIIEEQGQVLDYEIEWKRKDGSIIQILLTGHTRCDAQGRVLGYEGIVVDQSQRKQMENKMKEAYDFLDKTILCSPNAIMATDLKGDVIIWNQGAEEIFDYKADEVVGKMNIQSLYSEGLARKVMKMMRSDDYGGTGKLKSYPITFHNRHGEPVEGNLSASILYDDEGNEIASVGNFVDLTERLKMERKLSRTRQQLLQSEKLAAMGRLTSQIAHELNNPLFGIMNTLELMKSEVPAQNKRRKLLDMSISEIERLAEMLRKMLSFSNPEEDEQVPVDINTVIEEIILLYDKQFRENSIKLTTSLAEIPGKVQASKDKLRQVFLNLISNAMDAMPDGGKLNISTSVEENRVYIMISDTGTGIKEEHLGKIFEAFFTTKKDSIKGVGLGLSVCYGFIKEHGGDLQVQSTPGEGTEFTIMLPLISAE